MQEELDEIRSMIEDLKDSLKDAENNIDKASFILYHLENELNKLESENE